MALSFQTTFFCCANKRDGRTLLLINVRAAAVCTYVDIIVYLEQHFAFFRTLRNRGYFNANG